MRQVLTPLALGHGETQAYPRASAQTVTVEQQREAPGHPRRLPQPHPIDSPPITTSDVFTLDSVAERPSSDAARLQVNRRISITMHGDRTVPASSTRPLPRN